MLSQSRNLIIGALSVMMLSACNPTEQPKAAVAVTVNGTPISQSRVDLLVKQGTSQGQPDSPELRKKIIDQLSMQVLISQEAVKKGLDKKPEVLDQIDLTRQSILTNAFVKDYMKNSPVTDDMVNAEYEKIKAQMAGSEYRARHILVDKEAEAKDIIAQLKKNPKAFESLAKARSKDTGSKAGGGELGWFDLRAMVPEFGAAVEKLTKGQFTQEPVKSQFGYHVILLEDTRPKTIPPLDQVKSQLQKQVQQQNLQKLFDDMKAKAKIEIVQAATPAVMPSDKVSPANGSKPAEPVK
jgi:peptidyl-prolyl cis-trans isomerase C